MDSAQAAGARIIAAKRKQSGDALADKRRRREDAPMAKVELRHLWKRYGEVLAAVEDFSLTTEDGEFMVFLGPSGCGKSTLLRMIAGLESPSDGEIRIGGERVDDRPPGKRGVAMVFQNYALFPHLKVLREPGVRTAECRRQRQRDRGADQRGRARFSKSKNSWTGARRNCPAVSVSVLPSAAPSCGTRGVPVRRAAVQSRRRTACAHARRTRRIASAHGGDHDLCHARSGRGA